MLGSYSLDNVVVDFECRKEGAEELAYMLGFDSDNKDWFSRKVNSFKNNHSVQVDLDNSFYVGIGANWISGGINNLVRFDFNPNKVLHSEKLKKMLKIANFSSSGLFEIKRFDIAIDFDVAREKFILVKDNRSYSQFSNSIADKTEYLGRRSCHGRVKLYNKKLESKLEFERTRLELTVDFNLSNGPFGFQLFQDIFPRVYCLEDIQLGFDSIGVSSTDYVLFLACVDVPERLKLLTYHKRKKVEEILRRFSNPIEADKAQFDSLLLSLNNMFDLL